MGVSRVRSIQSKQISGHELSSLGGAINYLQGGVENIPIYVMGLLSPSQIYANI